VPSPPTGSDQKTYNEAAFQAERAQNALEKTEAHSEEIHSTATAIENVLGELAVMVGLKR